MNINRIYCFDGSKMVALSPMEQSKAQVKAKATLSKLDQGEINIGGEPTEDAAYFRHKSIDFLVSSSGRVWHHARHLDDAAVPKQLQREVWDFMKTQPDHEPGDLAFFFFPHNGMRFGMSDGEVHQPMLMLRSPLMIG